MPAASLALPLDQIAEICERHRVRDLAVFGSVLRDDFRAESDVDLLISFLPGTRVGLFKLADIQEELSCAIGRRVDLVPREGLNPVIREQVLGAARTLYRSDELYLRDIVVAADDLAELVEGLTAEEFSRRMLERRAALQALTEIGEASARISADLKSRYSQVHWKKATDMRNFAVHAYFGVEWGIIHETICGEIPKLREQVHEILSLEYPRHG